jgi:hypothetical protein
MREQDSVLLKLNYNKVSFVLFFFFRQDFVELDARSHEILEI